PNVGDKLLNLLQLAEDKTQSDLLLASIAQKGDDLKPVPFQKAISYKKNLKYAYYAAIPVLFILLAVLVGRINIFTESYKRVIDYQTAYTAPAHSEFLIANDSLTTVKGKSFTLDVQTQGSSIPRDVHIDIDGRQFFMENTGDGTHQYTFQQPI